VYDFTVLLTDMAN